MPIYGYKKAVVDKRFGLLELREISLMYGASDLRRIAAFLDHVAELLESDDRRPDHIHLTTFDADWSRDHPEIDMIVLNADPAPASKVV